MAKKLLGLVLAILMAVPTTSFAEGERGATGDGNGLRITLAMQKGLSLSGTVDDVVDDMVTIRRVTWAIGSLSTFATGEPGSGRYRLPLAGAKSIRLESGKHPLDATSSRLWAHLLLGVAKHTAPERTSQVRLRAGGLRRGHVLAANEDGLTVSGDGVALLSYDLITELGPRALQTRTKVMLGAATAAVVFIGYVAHALATADWSGWSGGCPDPASVCWYP